MNDAEIKKYIDEVDARSDMRMEKYIAKLKKESDAELKHYLGALKEDIAHKMDAIMEVVEPLIYLPAKVDRIDETVQEMKITLDATFERAGELTEDVEVLKVTVARHQKQLTI